MDDSELFDEYARSCEGGPRFDLTELPREVSDIYDRYLKRARAALASTSQKLPGLPAVYADFVVNPAFNAFAFEHKGRYFIAFHNGLPVILAMVVYRILADGRLFSEVGNPKAESDNLPLFTDLTPNALLLTTSNPAAVVPKNPQRLLYAIHLCHVVFDFLAAHEIAHIAHGHVDYSEAECGIHYLSEMNWLSHSASSNLESQAMEFDADSTAASVLVNTVKGLFSLRTQMLPEVAAFYHDPAQAMFDVAVAVSIIFRLLDHSCVTGVNLSAEDHPPTRWRQMMILQMMGNYVDHFWDSNLTNAVEAALTKAIAEVEKAFELITGSEQHLQGLHDAWFNYGWTHAKSVTDCWNNLVRAKVATYAYIEPNSYHFDLPTS